MFCRKLCYDFIKSYTFKQGTLYITRNLATHFKRNINRDIIQTTLEGSHINSIKDWSNVRKTILEHELNRGRFSNDNMDAMIVGYCLQSNDYNLATSYINFLKKENIKLNLATTGKYLRLLYLKNYQSCLETEKTCSKTEEETIIKYYEDLRKNYPVLDSVTLENVILALSLTSRWKECLDLFKEVKVSAVPYGIAYSAVIASCFLHNEENLGWQLLEEMLGHEKTPASVPFLAYLKSIQRLKKKEKIIEKLEKLFLFFQEFEIRCGEDVATNIAELGKKLGYRPDLTPVSYRGQCNRCSQKLNNFQLTNEEFEELKTKIFEKVIVGKDVFAKTTPEEVARFKKFVDGMGRFDVVLDGLNVAYSAGTKHPPEVLSALVASVVSHFVQQNKKVLVLGRAHMHRWPGRNWGYVKQNASIFLAQDISQDDPYLLYCALSSGKNTVIVTRDLMRSHRFLLKVPKLKMLFNRWLSQRQWQLVRVDERRKPMFKIPPPFSILAQCDGQGTWHIPYQTEDSKETNDYHRTWLCFKK